MAFPTATSNACSVDWVSSMHHGQENFLGLTGPGPHSPNSALQHLGSGISSPALSGSDLSALMSLQQSGSMGLEGAMQSLSLQGQPSGLNVNDLALLGYNSLLQQTLGADINELLALKDALRKIRGNSAPNSANGHATGPVNNGLYKTELCRSWEETGTCRYGAKCQFAHGREELRPVQRHPKYKTELCRTFATTGTCPYGTRCRFIHHNINSSGPPAGFQFSSSAPGSSNGSGPIVLQATAPGSPTASQSSADLKVEAVAAETVPIKADNSNAKKATAAKPINGAIPSSPPRTRKPGIQSAPGTPTGAQHLASSAPEADKGASKRLPIFAQLEENEEEEAQD